MKIITKSILVTFLSFSFLMATSCKKDDDGGSGGNAGSGTISAKVNGDSFTSMEIASTATLTTGGSTTTVVLQGSDADGKGIFIIMNGFEGTGTYEFSDSNVFVTATYVEANVSNPQNTQTWSAPYQNSGIVGEVNVSEKTDTTIKGTFNFTAKNVNGDGSLVSITDGSFNLDF